MITTAIITACVAGPISVDLAGDTALQRTVDQEAGQYLGHPSTVLLPDGMTMFCVYPKGHGRGPIVLKRSDDGGRTWSERLKTPASWETSKETPHVYEMLSADGVRRLVLFSGLYPIRSSISGDDGRTWSELEAIGTYGGIVAVADVMPTAAGCYSAVFHDDGRFLRQAGEADSGFKVYAIDTTDGGISWSEPRVVAELPDAHLCEPGLVQSPDEAWWAMLLRENSRKKNSHICFSNDSGKTWSAPRELPDALTGDRHQCIYLADGRLMVSFRDTHPKSPWCGDWVAWIGSWGDLEHCSGGDYLVRLSDNHHRWDCAYPALERLPDGTIVAITYGHWVKGEPPFIRAVHLTPKQIASLFPEIETDQ
ncbi:MAG: exo-alpha-sialidase [Planctomycetes bacterium]|nr:exo-alpha-sialidase [Planctomycetota bacterium]